MSVTFLPFAAERLDDLLEMMARLYQHDAMPWDEERSRTAIHALLAAPQAGAIWLIQADLATVGYLVLTMSFSLEFHGRYALLDEFFVEEQWRGRGIGTQALSFAQRHCRQLGLQTLRLEVSHANLAAIDLYRRCGFHLHDRHLMTCYL